MRRSPYKPDAQARERPSLARRACVCCAYLLQWRNEVIEVPVGRVCMAVCHFHSDRPGVGVCMRCRRPICAACCTRLDGVNHCHACLKALGTRPEPGRRTSGLRPLLRSLFLILGWGTVFFLLWCLQGRLVP